jgi:hypothetical protein
MFKRHAKSGLARFWPVQSARVVPGLRTVELSNAAHSNDNLPDFRRAVVAGKRRSPLPALTCRWSDHNGRLECRWQVETANDDAPNTDVDEHEHSGLDPTIATYAGRRSSR